MKIINHLLRKRSTLPKISVSENEFIVLDLVAKFNESGICTADMQVELAKLTGKEWRMATLYGLITELGSKRLIQNSALSHPDNGGRPRKLYSLTEGGQLAQRLGEQLVSVGTGSMPIPA